MLVRNVGKWVLVTLVPLGTAVIAASCGGSNDTSVFNGDSGASDDATSSGGDGQMGRSDSSFGGSSGGDGPTGCTPKTCAQLGFNCGKAVTCGMLINCNANGSDAAADCPGGEVCGAMMPNVCGTGSSSSGGDGGKGDGGNTCTAKTCMQLGYDCGEAVTCGMVINCNANGSTTPDCPPGQICGGNGMANQCVGGVSPDGSVNCTPKTCAGLGYTCGLASDGCNGTINCNANGSTTTPDCPTGEICGYGGVPNVCGPSSTSSGCEGGTTTLTGYVYDPANHLPVYNALVYVPAGAVQTPPTGVNGMCGCTSQPAFVSTFTAVDGSFTLTNPPAGASVTVVVQLGKWQRSFTENITACQTNTLGSHLTLPSTRAQGNIPRFAIDTGAVDAMECVLLKMGLDPTEFADPSITAGVPTAPQRIHMYEGKIVAGGAIIDANTPAESALTENITTLDSYDVALFPCQGAAGTYNAANGYPNTLANLETYANAGGRLFTTHYHYDMLYNNGSFAGTATWNTPFANDGAWGNYYGDTKYNSDIIQTFGTGAVLAQWLNQPVVYGGTLGVIPVGVIRNNFKAVTAPGQLWLESAGGGGGPPKNTPLHYTFDTPFVAGGADGTCGRVVYSDFHVESQPNAATFTGATFPNECPGGTAPTSMTPQEELLEFMLFDLTSCVAPPTCTPLTCADYPTGTCGQQSDGCGNLTMNCGTCMAPQTCGGGGTPNMCGAPDAGSCTPKTCAQQGIACGQAGDGCGAIIQCPACPMGQTCVSGQCYAPDAGPPKCIPKTCAQQGIQCGLAGDGCGNIIQCPACPTGQTCNSSGQCMSGSQ
ncbi:MAG TPA: hypothetical protein VMI75_15920 [Polyangiaceae bacterium]|nr:hypothetical protein [Polyangiaceae bacterium]